MKITLKAKSGEGELTVENKEITGDPSKKLLGGPSLLETVASVSIGSTTILVDIDELVRASKALQPTYSETTLM